MLEKYDYHVLQTTTSYDEAIESLEKYQPDLVLLDVNLSSKKTGIDLGKIISEKYKIPFIYITSYSDKQTVALAKETKPNGYIVKPFSEEDLYTSIEVALANYTAPKALNEQVTLPNTTPNNTFFVRVDKHFVKLNALDILWLQSDGNYLYVFTDNKKTMLRSSFKDFVKNLSPSDFIQIHKSYYVNIHKIESFTSDEVFINNTNLPISKVYKDELFNKLNRVT